MHLFYYQQGFFAETEDDGARDRSWPAGTPPAAALTPSTPSAALPSLGSSACLVVAAAQARDFSHAAGGNNPGDSGETSTAAGDSASGGAAGANAAAAAAGMRGARAAAAAAGGTAGYPSADVGRTSGNALTLWELRSRRAELQWRLETGALKAENTALEGQVVQMQEDFVTLQDEFKDMKEKFGERLAALERALEAQQAVTSVAERRVICTEDLVRFYEEQRRHMAGHWKAQCQVKDERIRYLNLQLTEYTIDWQHLGTQKQTEASLSHELQCLKDRHGELKADATRREARKEQLVVELAQTEQTEAELREAQTLALSEAKAAAEAGASAKGGGTSLEDFSTEFDCAGLRGQLRLLRNLCQQQERREGQPGDRNPPWPHACIWRDELDVRERQLEKITAQLDRTNNALHAAQAALAEQRARHEDMKSRHREAEADLREAERRRARRQRQCAELRRVETEIRFALEANGTPAAAPAHLAVTSTASAAAASTASSAGRRLSGADGGGGRSQLSVRERMESIGRETQRIVALQHGTPPAIPGPQSVEPTKGSAPAAAAGHATGTTTAEIEEPVTPTHAAEVELKAEG
eukprot:TRINITY_DN29716_c0_g1_i1.p1 TRINITY_DN29716_c0_g1~~TRINITY_DN29716_c0_g1_i1.p1  ORF type:complete len:585 (-),score=157.89 TRINITY_DN29716_c0_g1_i1:46-1800(-)